MKASCLIWRGTFVWTHQRVFKVLAVQISIFEQLSVFPFFRWFNFERVVQILVSKGVYHLHLQELQTIIRDVCFIENEEEVSTMLDFYHDLGVIVRHRNTVVLQAQWLIEVLKQLITIRSFNDMVGRKIAKCMIIAPLCSRNNLSTRRVG